MTRIVVVEDHTLVRQSLVKTVNAEDDLEVVGQAGLASEALEVVASVRPDIVMLDIGLPDADGLDLGARIRRLAPSVKIVFVTMHDDDASLRAAIGQQAEGFLPKRVNTEELLFALRSVAAGKTYVSPDIASRLMKLASGRGGPGAELTDRELEVLRLLASGQRPADVSRALFISPKTTKNHLGSIYQKLSVNSAAQAVAEAYRRGLVSFST